MTNTTPRLVCALLLSLCFPLGCAGDSSSDTDGTAEGDDNSDSGGPTGSCIVYPETDATADVFVGSGAAPGNSCELDVTACGGDPVGTWTLDTACGYDDLLLPSNPFEMDCPGANFTPTMPRRTGTLTVADNGTWQLDTTIVFDYEFGADISCLGFVGCGPDAEAILTQAGGTASCSGGQPSACSCTVTDAPLESTQLTGRLGDGGTTLEAEDSLPIPFCVDDNVLTLWTLALSGSSFGNVCNIDTHCSTDEQSVGVCTPD
jgi:hypothetical protein